MKLTEALQPESTPETAIEYYRDAKRPENESLMVALSKFSLLTVDEMTLKEFWDKKQDIELVNQFIKATMNIGLKTYKLKPKGDTEFDKYKSIITILFDKKRATADIKFELEPGYDFKGVFGKDKFSITKIRHDREEASSGKKEFGYEQKRQSIRKSGKNVPLA